MMKKIFYTLLATLFLLMGATEVSAQHTFGGYVGYGMSTARFYPQQETRGVWGMYTTGLSWRHYTKHRFVGGFGLDLEFLQSAYSYAPYASVTEFEKDYLWYTRRINTLSLPVIWQPHFYIAERVRIYLEAMATFSYRFGGTYENQIAEKAGLEHWEGKYPYKTARDNRWGYGLAGGGGFAFLIGQWEVGARVRYYFGYGDILRNRNKYAGNTIDGPENPFWGTPLRSPLDNLMIHLTLSYRFGKEGFEEWKHAKRKREKRSAEFNYSAAK